MRRVGRKSISWVNLGLAAVGLAVALPAGAFTAFIDRFSSARDGLNPANPAEMITFFADNFDDGNPPPSAPLFSNGTAAQYGVLGTFDPGIESGGLLALDSSRGESVFNAAGQPRDTLRATLRTNVDPTMPSFGLRQPYYFEGGGVFRLDGLPSAWGDLISIEANDEKIGVAAVERLQVSVRRGSPGDPADNSLVLIFAKQVFGAGGGVTIISETPLPVAPAGANAISLGLVHQANSGSLTAFYRYLNDLNPLSDRIALQGAGTMFDGEDHVRMGFFVTQVPEPGTWVMLLAGLGALGWMARRRAG